MLPEILLDDVRFQELVSEARTRIVRHAPEWTEHNVSDPGITLIELYAWLTELLVYRINRIPERLHFGLLALVGVEPRPPECASVPVRFMIDRPGGGAVVPAGTEIASPRTAGSDSRSVARGIFSSEGAVSISTPRRLSTSNSASRTVPPTAIPMPAPASTSSG